jgi:hypothetical protein
MKKEIVWESYEDAKKRIEAEKAKKKETKKTTVKKDTKKTK